MRNQDHSHSPDSIAERLAQAARPSYLRDFVFGGVDGSITTFAIVSGVWGADLSHRTIVILGLANLIADGFSMAAGNYLSSKAEHENVARLRELEERHISLYPEGEREEIRQIFSRKGVEQPALESIVTAICSDRKGWIDLMLFEEYGVSPLDYSPVRAAASTFIAFVICGSVPLISFVGRFEQPFLVAALGTGLTLFLIGSAKSRWSNSSWWGSGFQTFSVGFGAAIVAYLIGSLFK